MEHLKILSAPCHECLFSDHKIVSDERKADVLKGCQDEDAHFICHRATLLQWKGVLTEQEANICCNGFYRNDPNATTWMQIAGRLDWIEWVDPRDLIEGEPGFGVKKQRIFKRIMYSQLEEVESVERR